MYFKIQSQKAGSGVWKDVPMKPIHHYIGAVKIRQILWMASHQQHSCELKFRIVKVRS